MNKLFTILIFLVIFSTISAQQCIQSTRDTIQTCLDTIYSDESKNPCSSTDWKCICNVQQGLISCHSPCPELQPYDDLLYNNNNCNRQHGDDIVNVAADSSGGATYSGSPITTTVEIGKGSGGETPTAVNSISTITPTASSVTPTSPTKSTTSATSTNSVNRSASTSSLANLSIVTLVGVVIATVGFGVVLV